MKRMYLTAIVMVLAGGAVFARGSMESTGSTGFGGGAGSGNYRSGTLEGDVETFTGTILEQDGRVVLETSEGLYTLSAGGYRRNPVDIPFGETVTVTGSAVDCDGENCVVEDCVIDADGHVFVESAGSGSETYTFDTGRGPSGAAGGRYSEDSRGNRNMTDSEVRNGRGNTAGRMMSGNQQPRGGRGAGGRGGMGFGLMDGSGIEGAE